MPRPPRQPNLTIPDGLRWWRTVTGGADWLDMLPRLVAECAEQWSLEVGVSFEQAHVSLVTRVRLPDGTPAVLKINFPDAESEHEPGALEHWNGKGAVRLLAYDGVRRALLVEHCQPGTTLWALQDEKEANAIAAEVLGRLWRPPSAEHAFRPLSSDAERWVEELPHRWEKLGGPFERELLDQAVSFLRDAGPNQGELVVVHQDFHGGNVLRATREPWLAIDPKPLVGEREFDTASLLRDRRQELGRDPQPARTVSRRLDQLASELELDRGRMRGWGIAHALAWGMNESVVLEDMIACARWLAESRL
jgi:streptomycin 6-kinase